MSSNISKITLYIDNMTCVNCENVIERELSKEDGVVSVTASYSSGTAVIDYDESMISLEKIIESIEKAGYHARKERTANRSTPEHREGQSLEQQGQPAGKGRDYTNIVGAAIIIFALYLIANRLGFTNIIYNFPVAKDGMGYGMLFLIGLLTSVHCVAMCGGICLSQCVPQKEGASAAVNKFAALRPSILYNTGRVISYTVIGGIVGALGSVVSFSGTLRGVVQILAGVFMVIMGINMLNIFPWLRKFNPRMPKIFAKKIYAKRNSNSPLFIGLLNGLMPCGPLQAMQLYALSTGSPLKGALSMFLFSVGTVPLMFAFGAISSLLSKKFTSKMMTVSAVLVVVLGVFMFNYGLGLSGVVLPSLPISTSEAAESASVAIVQNGVQVVTSGLSSGRYDPIVVQKGIPVKWTIKAEAGDINGCNNGIIIQKYGIEKQLQEGDNLIEFTPTETGTVAFSCWMGMIRSKITVVDSLNNIDDSALSDDGVSNIPGGGCCAGGSGYPGGSGSGSSSGASLTFPDGQKSYDKLVKVKIPTDKVEVAKVTDNLQTVSITYGEDGLSPAVIIVQKGKTAEWTINGSNVAADSNTLVFPYYNAQVSVVEGKTPIKFIPDQDFDFFSSDGSYLGYVKVVDDINKVDLKAIKEEISEFKPTDIDVLIGGSGSAS